MPSIGGRDLHAGLPQHVERGLQGLGSRVLQKNVAAGHGDRHRVGAGLDAVGQYRVARAAEFGNALDNDPRRAGAGDLRAHLVEAIGDVGDLRFACGVLDHRGAAGERRRHDSGVRAADRHFRKHDLAALEPVRRARNDIAAVDLDLGAKPLDRHDQQIDRPRTDGAAARHRNARVSHARDQRGDHPKARPHLRHEIVGRGRVDDACGRNVQGLAVVRGFAEALAADHDVDAVIAKDTLQQSDVGQPRHVVEDERLVGQQTCDHQRERGVLRSRDRNDAVERPSPDDANSIHETTPARFPRI